MKKLPIIAGVFTLVATMTHAQALDSLRVRIDARLAQEPGTFGVCVRDLSSGSEMLLNAHEVFHAASTMKTPVMIEVFRQARQGKFSLSDSIEVRNEFRSIVDSSLYSMEIGEDSDDSMYGLLGKKSTIRALVVQMITVSSNLATNLLIDLVGAKNVNTTMRELGAPDIQVLRGVEDIKAFRLGLNNTTTAYDLMVVMAAIAEGKAGDSASTAEMLDILAAQKWRSKIPALLPEGTRVAHKTGSITGVEHDSGIVYLPEGRAYVVVLLSKDVPDSERAIRALAEVSRMIYDDVNRKR